MTDMQRPDRGAIDDPEDSPAPVDVRQQLAADQTLFAWIRTAIALSALGFVVARFNLFLHQVQRVSATGGEAARTIGLALVAAAAFLLVLGLVQHRQVTALLPTTGIHSMSPGGRQWSRLSPPFWPWSLSVSTSVRG